MILYRDEDVAKRVKEITRARACEVVYDGVGKSTFPASLDCLKPFGVFVSFGSASGPIDAFNIGILAPEGLALRDPADARHPHRREARDARGDRERPLRRSSGAARSKIPVHARAKLAEAADVHRALEGARDDRRDDLTPDRGIPGARDPMITGARLR